MSVIKTRSKLREIQIRESENDSNKEIRSRSTIVCGDTVGNGNNR